MQKKTKKKKKKKTGIFIAFLDNIQKLFTWQTDLKTAHSDTYLSEFLRFHTAPCDGPITESEIWEALKLVVRDKTPESIVIFIRCS